MSILLSRVLGVSFEAIRGETNIHYAKGENPDQTAHTQSGLGFHRSLTP